MSFVNPLKKFDLDYIKDSSKLLAGVDEAGRGPLAGPVVAAAVVFKNSIDIPLVDDSKKIKESDREILYERIINESISFGIGIVDNNDIDEINIPDVLEKFLRKSKQFFFTIPLGDNDRFRIREYEVDITHVTKKDEEWWINMFEKNGFKLKEFRYNLGSIKEKWIPDHPYGNGFFILESVNDITR